MVRKNRKLSFRGCNYFRQRISLSILSGIPIEITDVRSGYDEPGLKEFEVNLLRLVDKMTNGMMLEVDETGTSLFFQPGLLTGGVIDHECCKQRGIGYYLEVVLLLAPFFKKGIQLTLRGVTNNEKDVSVDAFKYAAIPLLKRFAPHEDELELTIRKRGAEPNGGGEIYFNCPNIRQLKPAQVMDYGKIKRIRGTVFSLRVSPAISSRIVEKSKGVFLKFLPDVYLSVDHLNGQRAGKSPGFGACLVAESTTGVFLTSEMVSTPGHGAKTVPEDLAEKVAHLLLEEICRGGCVDSSFQCLAAVYMALQPKDVSQYLFGPLSPYTVQFFRHMKEFFGITFKLEPFVEPDGDEIKHILNKETTSMDDMELSSLLTNAEQLALNPEESIGELPKIERTLKQVYDATNEMWARLTSEGVKDNEANLLMSTRGVDLTNLSRKLECITSRQSVEPLDVTPVTDVDGYFKNEHDNAIFALCEESAAVTRIHMDNLIRTNIRRQTVLRTTEYLNTFFGLAELDPEVPITKLMYPVSEQFFRSGGVLDRYQIGYAEKLVEYNKHLIRSQKKLDLISSFSSVCSPQDQKLKELWNIISIMVKFPMAPAESVLQSRITNKVVDKLITLGRNYLESRYKVFMETVVNNNLLKACRGGEPGTYSLVRSFVKASNLTEYLGMEPVVIDGLPFWPVLYYCLRCGDLDAAIGCTERSGTDTKILTNILLEMKNTPLRQISDHLEGQCVQEYKRHIRTSPDPFKRLVYCLILGCDVQDKHSEVIKTADDYLWLRLCQVRKLKAGEKPETPSEDRLTFPELQCIISEEYVKSFYKYVHYEKYRGKARQESQKIKDDLRQFTNVIVRDKLCHHYVNYCEAYFNAAEQPFVYFQMLVLTGQFESAIEVLFKNPKFATHAVHVAIALNEYGVLALVDTSSRPLLCAIADEDPKPLKRINFYLMIKIYNNLFDDVDPEIALHYLFTVRNIQFTIHEKRPEHQRFVYPELVCDLVTKCGNFDKLLGYLEKDGCRVKGLIDQFKVVKFPTNRIIDTVAMRMELKGRSIDAIRLYELCGNYEKMMTLWSYELSKCLTETGAPAKAYRDMLFEFSNVFMRRTSTNVANVRIGTRRTFDIYRILYAFYQNYSLKEYRVALSLIQDSKLLPFSTEDVDQLVVRFKEVGELVVQAVPNLLIAVMNILHTQYNELKQNYLNKEKDGSYEKSIQLLRKRAQAIVSFAGRVSFNLLSDTYSRLVQMEVEMR